MAFVTEQLALLGLNEREVRVFTALATFGRMNMSKIAGRAGLPRTTVDYIVRGMVDQGLVTREMVGGRQEYAVVLTDVADRLDTLEQRLRPQDGAEQGTKDDEKIVTCTPLDAHARVEQAFVNHDGDRVSILLGELATNAERVVALEHYLTYARRSSAKLEVLTSMNVANTMSAYAKDLLFLISSRTVWLSLLPPSFCLEGVDMLVFRDEVLAIDHRKQRLERITGGLGIEAIKHLLFVARETAWNVDTRTFLEERMRHVEVMPES